MERSTRGLMFASLLLFAAVIMATCGACASAVRYRSSKVFDAQSRAAVKVLSVCTIDGAKPRIALGSGVIVSSGYVMTAYHVVVCDGPVDIVVSLPDNTVIEATLVGRNVTDDLARLQLDTDVPYPTLRIGPPPRVGSRVCTAAAVPDRTRRCGDVQRVTGKAPGNIQHDGITEPGNSGSGLYDDQGRLVGIVTHLRLCASTGQICGGSATSLRGRVLR